jgi:hypothetical protein
MNTLENQFSVTSIRDYAFFDRTSLSSVACIGAL